MIYYFQNYAMLQQGATKGDRLMEKTGVRVSVPTMYRAVEKLDLRSKKKLSTLFVQETERVRELRHDYRRWLDQIDVRNLVFVDEAGLNLSMSRLFALSRKRGTSS